MLLIILFVVLLALGALLFWLNNNSDSPFWYSDVCLYIGAALIAVGLVCSLLFGSITIVVQTTKDVDYQVAVSEREALVYRLEHSEEKPIGNEMLYNDIVKFNADLRVTKNWADSPWVGCFFNEKIAGLDYIEYKEG